MLKGLKQSHNAWNNVERVEAKSQWLKQCWKGWSKVTMVETMLKGLKQSHNGWNNVKRVEAKSQSLKQS